MNTNKIEKLNDKIKQDPLNLILSILNDKELPIELKNAFHPTYKIITEKYKLAIDTKIEEINAEIYLKFRNDVILTFRSAFISDRFNKAISKLYGKSISLHIIICEELQYCKKAENTLLSIAIELAEILEKTLNLNSAISQALSTLLFTIKNLNNFCHCNLIDLPPQP